MILLYSLLAVLLFFLIAYLVSIWNHNRKTKKIKPFTPLKDESKKLRIHKKVFRMKKSFDWSKCVLGSANGKRKRFRNRYKKLQLC